MLSLKSHSMTSAHHVLGRLRRPGTCAGGSTEALAGKWVGDTIRAVSGNSGGQRGGWTGVGVSRGGAKVVPRQEAWDPGGGGRGGAQGAGA